MANVANQQNIISSTDFQGKFDVLNQSIELVWVLLGASLILLMNVGFMFVEIGAVS